MNVTNAPFAALGWVMLIATSALAQEAQQENTPVPFPKLEHFASLWERSIFTTRDLPSPDAPAGPNFADNLSLSGIYEIDGAVVAVLVDRTTSQVMEAHIDSENELGIKIRQVTPGASVDKTRIQLQKGDQAGWVSFGDPYAQQAEVIQRAVIPTQAAPVPKSVRAAPPMPVGTPPNPILPPPANPVPAAPVNDVPLPPP